MYNCELMERLNSRLLPEERIFKLSSVSVRKNKYVHIVLITAAKDYDSFYNFELQEKTEDVLKSILPTVFDITVDIIKSYTDEDRILTEITEYVYKSYPAIFDNFRKMPINISVKGNLITVAITADDYFYSFCTECEIDKKLAARLDGKFMEAFEVVLILKEGEEETADEAEEFDKDSLYSKLNIKFVTAPLQEHILGIISRSPRYISDVNTSDSTKTVICGTVSGLRAIKTKKNPEKEFYIFSLDDTTATINVKFFPKAEKAINAGKKLADGMKIAIEGDIQYDSYDDSYAMFMRKMASCEIDFDSISVDPIYVDAPEAYKTIIPEKYNEEEQMGLSYTAVGANKAETSENDAAESVVINVELAEKNGAEVISKIQAVSIKGMLPELCIKADYINSDDPYKKPPLFSSTIGDIYKFVQGKPLIHLNNENALHILVEKGKKAAYNFDNEITSIISFASAVLGKEKLRIDTLCKQLELPYVVTGKEKIDINLLVDIYLKLLKEKKN